MIGQYGAAAEHAHSFGSYAEYQHDVTLRREIACRLRLKVVQLGGTPRGGGTVAGWLKRTLVHLQGFGIGNEMWVLRLFEREERHVMGCIRALVDDRRLSSALRHELSAILTRLDDELRRLQLFHERPGSVKVVQ